MKLGIHDILYAARRMQAEANDLGLGSCTPAQGTRELRSYEVLYDALVTSPTIRSVSRKLYIDGHYARAVEEAYKCLNNTVKAKSGLLSDGQDLMNQAFSAKSPKLRLTPMKNQSDRDAQQGYMQVFAGCMACIRNPRAHEHLLQDDPQAALEMLAWANHLMRVLDRSVRARRRNSVKATTA